MPDLESLVCGGGSSDGKVACETLIGADDRRDRNQPPAAEDPDLPAESFRVRIGDEIDWADINHVYDRDDSTKGTTNPKSQNYNNPNPKPGSNSQRFSGNLKPKAPIFGLPNKIQLSGYLGHSACRLTNGWIFPKKAAGGGKSAVPEDEPGSPKVSCFGKVRLERERDQFSAHSRKSPEEREEEGGSGCWASLAAAIGCCGGGDRVVAAESVEKGSSATSENIPASARNIPAEAAISAPGLGGMMRFASGRRSASWGGDGEQ